MARVSRKNKAAADEPAVKTYKTAIYARLSKENPDGETIDAQIELVKSYLAKRRELELVDVYADNGYSGTNFNRPEFERLMEDLREHKVDCIVVKDLSRFAREHIGAEDYLNNIFPFLGIRLISIMDGYDNINIQPEEYFMASFKNLAHAHFAMETSQKTAMAKHAMQEQGKFVGGRCSFGFRRDPKDRHKLTVFEPEAAVVLEIFERVATGEKPNDVRLDLNKRKVLDPPWTAQRMRSTLKNEYYKGTLVLRQTMKLIYKDGKKRHIPKEHQLRFENAVPVIVPPEIWDKAREQIAARKTARENSPECPYRGIVYCGVCNEVFIPSYSHSMNDFRLYCKKCKRSIGGRHINRAIRQELGLPENAEVSKALIADSFTRIILSAERNFSFQKSNGEDL